MSPSYTPYISEGENDSSAESSHSLLSFDSARTASTCEIALSPFLADTRTASVPRDLYPIVGAEYIATMHAGHTMNPYTQRPSPERPGSNIGAYPLRYTNDFDPNSDVPRGQHDHTEYYPQQSTGGTFYRSSNGSDIVSYDSASQTFSSSGSDRHHSENVYNPTGESSGFSTGSSFDLTSSTSSFPAYSSNDNSDHYSPGSNYTYGQQQFTLSTSSQVQTAPSYQATSKWCPFRCAVPITVSDGVNHARRHHPTMRMQRFSRNESRCVDSKETYTMEEFISHIFIHSSAYPQFKQVGYATW